ncbi:MAG TPA: hypothetical protein QF564_22100 [Pirellulaceae bacterium]|nr:hypothetical protein [Pirellulaceae bacterium]
MKKLLVAILLVSLVAGRSTYSEQSMAEEKTFSGHHNSDGIAISSDGLRWFRLTQLDRNLTDGTFDLDGAIQAAGVTYTSDFRIKFQQYDNYPASTDGRAFDNIRVSVS